MRTLKFSFIVGALATVPAFTVPAFTQVVPSTQSQGQASSDSEVHLLTRGPQSLWPVEDAAAANKSNSDPEMMRVADAVFKTSMLYGLPITTPLRQAYEQKLVAVERNFQNGTSAGITVDQLANLYNQVAQALGSQTQTDSGQLTFLRWQLATQEPHFIKSDGALSPLQGIHLLSMLLFQKLNNDAYKDKGNPFLTPAQQRIALQNSIRSGFQKLSQSDGLMLLGKAANLFGVN